MKTTRIHPVVSLFLCLLCPLVALAQQSHESFGDYQVHYSVFNSSFIQPDIAKNYQLTRGKDRGLINIAVVKKTDGGYTEGLPATISGVARNLMQQKTDLQFQQIKEQTAVYYLAPFRFLNEEVMHFDIQVNVDGQPPFNLTFNRKLYVDP